MFVVDLLSEDDYMNIVKKAFFAVLIAGGVIANTNAAVYYETDPATTEEVFNTIIHTDDAAKIDSLFDAMGHADIRLDRDNTTPLLLAASMGRSKIVGTLLAHGANVNARGRSGKTALLLAIEQKNRGPVFSDRMELEMILPDIEHHNDAYVIEIDPRPYEEIVDVLLAYNADVSVADDSGATAWRPAIGASDLTSFRQLLYSKNITLRILGTVDELLARDFGGRRDEMSGMLRTRYLSDDLS
jgi:hypothetical protein